MHRIVVDEKKWIGEARFLHALNFCMLMPGPEAQQLATYIGWLMHGVRGALVAGLLFILPGFLSILALSIIYVTWNELPALTAIFLGLKAAVLAVVIQAVQRLGGRVLKTRALFAVAALAFLAIFFFKVPFPVVICTAAIVGLVGNRIWPEVIPVSAPGNLADNEIENHLEPGEQIDPEILVVKPTWASTLWIAILWVVIWWTPIIAVVLVCGGNSVYATEGYFFSKAALITFGGAYAVLPYIGQQAVERYHWLTSGQMLDGLGLAETTPGPLIMVVQFVGFLGAYHFAQQHPDESLPPLLAGVLGSVITVWATFAPCFLYIMTGARWVERLRRNVALSAALNSVTAAVVGVVLNLAIWFGIKALFRDVYTTSLFCVGHSWQFEWPAVSSISWGSLLCLTVASLIIFVLKRNIFVALGISVAIGAFWFAFWGKG